MDSLSPLRSISNALNLQIDLVEQMNLDRAAMFLKIAYMEVQLKLCQISQHELDDFIKLAAANYINGNPDLVRALDVRRVRH